MTKATSLHQAIEASIRDPQASASGEILLIAIPVPTYKAISDLAAKRGMTFGQFLAKAIDDYATKGESGQTQEQKTLRG